MSFIVGAVEFIDTRLHKDRCVAYNNFEDGITDANQGSASNSEAVALLSGSQTRMRLMNRKNGTLSPPASCNTFSSSSNVRCGTFMFGCSQDHSPASLIQLWRTLGGERRRNDGGGLPISAIISATS